MNIKKSFESIIEKYGHYVIYARQDLHFKCSCYIEKNGEADPRCPECLGTGHPISLERIKVRSMADNNLQRQSESQSHSKAGAQNPVQYEYFFKAEYEPKNNDLIIEVIFNEDFSVQKVISVNVIANALKMRGSQGEVAFYQVYSRFRGRNKENDKAISRNRL